MKIDQLIKLLEEKQKLGHTDVVTSYWTNYEKEAYCDINLSERILCYSDGPGCMANYIEDNVSTLVGKWVLVIDAK